MENVRSFLNLAYYYNEGFKCLLVFVEYDADERDMPDGYRSESYAKPPVQQWHRKLAAAILRPEAFEPEKLSKLVPTMQTTQKQGAKLKKIYI